MTSSLALLAQPHDVAVRTIISEALKEGLSIDDLLVGQYEVRSDGMVNQPVYIDSDAYDDPDWPYRGSVEMVHQRVDLQAALGHLGLKFRLPDEQFETSFVVGKIKSILQLHFDSTDYIHESHLVTTAFETVVLQATADSPRWKGQVDILVYR